MAKSNVWLSVSDLMTGLMIVFLFVSVAYMIRVKEEQTPLTQYVENKTELRDKLVAEFKDESRQGRLSISGDLTMRFENAQTLFEQGKDELTTEFKKELANCMPRYLNLLLNASMRDKIREIRIEGHTDDVPYPGLDPDPYFANLILSQRRALKVMRYIQSMPEYQAYSEDDRKQLEFWFTVAGMSFGRALDERSNYVYVSCFEIDKNKSRRVEFRLITSGEEMLEEFIKKNK